MGFLFAANHVPSCLHPSRARRGPPACCRWGWPYGGAATHPQQRPRAFAAQRLIIWPSCGAYRSVVLQPLVAVPRQPFQFGICQLHSQGNLYTLLEFELRLHFNLPMFG
jgi:hypothetical protein